MSHRFVWRALSAVFACVLLLGTSSALAAKPKRASKAAAGAPKAEATAPPKSEQSSTSGGDAEEPTRRGPARIEFDDRLVQGQTNKANAIYLFERRESALRSLLKKRTNFHDEIDQMLEDELVR
jgi:hypothetical protein